MKKLPSFIGIINHYEDPSKPTSKSFFFFRGSFRSPRAFLLSSLVITIFGFATAFSPGTEPFKSLQGFQASETGVIKITYFREDQTMLIYGLFEGFHS